MCSTVLALVSVLLGTELVRSHECTVLDLAVLNEAVEPELGTTPHYRECLLKEFFVLSVTVVCPQVACVPYVCNKIVVAPCTHTVVERRLCKHTPAITVVVLFSHLLPTVALCAADDEINEWLVKVTEISDFCWPVVHLDVDVCVDIGVPWRIGTTVVPDTLESIRSRNRLAV